MAKERNRRIVRTSAILVTLMLTALLCARGTTQLVASKVLPLADDEPAGGRRRAPSAALGEGPESIRQIAEAVLTRNIFDSQTGSMTWDVPVASAPVPENNQPTSDPMLTDGEPGFCQTGMRLIASMVVPQVPELSFANIEAQGKALLYRQGMQVDGHEVVGIREHRVFLRPSGRPMCQIAMFAPQAAAAPLSAAPAAPVAAEPAASEPKKTGGLAEEELNQGITQVSDTNYTVSRSLLDKVLQNQSELMRAARVIPYEENGKTIGVKVYGIRRTSILGKLGIQNGDVLRTINGFDLSSPDSALEAYTKLRTMDQFSIAMVRRGQARTMEYSVK